IVTAIIVLASIAVVVYCVLKKFHLLGFCCHGDSCTCEEDNIVAYQEAKDENGVQYTNDKDFV
ncbi:MAG: hypothetical protein FWD03_09350, partial [Defluviitaleaceae bacterium]|nr:hypothetical protein [Defluviitaleaceae bacterium]